MKSPPRDMATRTERDEIVRQMGDIPRSVRVRFPSDFQVVDCNRLDDAKTGEPIRLGSPRSFAPRPALPAGSFYLEEIARRTDG